MGIIYIIKNNVNKRVYIGQTVQKLEGRIKGHVWALNSGIHNKLYDAIRSIGPEYFYFDTLEICENKRLNEREVYWVKYYDSYNNGYNSTLGGNAAWHPVYDKHRDEIVNLYLSGVGSETIAKRFGCCGETILNILKAEEIEIRKNNKKVVITSLNKSFKSIRDAARYIIDNNLSDSTNINDVAMHITNMCKLGRQAYKLDITCNDIEQIDTASMYTACKLCGRTIRIETKSGMCNSCANVIAKGKTRKPSEEELKNLVEQRIKVKDIADMYDRTESTVYYWLHQYNLM